MSNKLPGLRTRLISGGLWSLGGRLIFLLLTLIINALIARLLSPADVGTYFLAQSLVIAVAALVSFGLPQTTVRMLSEAIATDQLGRVTDVVWKALLFVAGSATTVSVIWGLGTGRWLIQLALPGSGIGAVTVLFAVWLWGTTVQAAITEMFRGLHDIRLASLLGNVLPTSLNAVVLAIVWASRLEVGLDTVILVAIVATAVVCGSGIVLLWQRLRFVPGGRETQFVELIRESFRIGIIGIAAAVFGQCDIWIIGMFNSSEDLAIYGAAARLAAIFPAPLLVVNGVLAPIIAELYAKGDNRKLERILRTATTVCGLPVVVLVLLTMGYGEMLLGMIYGDYYREGRLLLCLLGVGQLVNVGTGASSLVLLMTGYQQVLMNVTLLTGAFRLCLIYWLTSRYGAQGTAMASVVSLSVQSIVLILVTKNRVGIWTHAGMEGFNELRHFFVSQRNQKHEEL